jgi:hypothetical protein
MDVGLDDGYAYTKVALPDGRLVTIPSRARVGSANVTWLDDSRQRIFEYETEDTRFAVGDLDGEPTYFDGYPFSGLNRAIVQHALQEAGAGGRSVHAVSGLPVGAFYLRDGGKNAVAKGAVRLYGKDHDIKGLVRDARQQVIERLHAETRRQLGLGAELDHILFVGGGTMALANEIRDWFPNQAIADRVREVTPKKGTPFLSVTIAALRGSVDKVRYSYFECSVAGKQAQEVVRELQAAVNKEQKVLVGFTLSDLYAEAFTYKHGERAGQTGASLKARLLRVTWAKVDGDPVYYEESRAA